MKRSVSLPRSSPNSTHRPMNEKPHSPRTRSRALRGAGAHQLPDCLTACCYEIEPGSAMDACRRTWAPKTADNFHCHACRSIGPSSEANISAIRCRTRSRPDTHNTGGPRRCPCCRNIRFKLPPIGEVRPCAGWARDARFERGTIPLGPFSADLETDRPHEVAVLHLESQIVQRRAVDPDAWKLEAAIRFQPGVHGIAACQPELAAAPQDSEIIVSQWVGDRVTLSLAYLFQPRLVIRDLSHEFVLVAPGQVWMIHRVDPDREQGVPR